MSTIVKPQVPAVRWNLSDLFAGIDDPKISSLWDALSKQADAFETRYRGRIESGSLSAAELADAIRESEAIGIGASKAVTFADLLFSCDSTDAAIGAFLAEQRENASELTVKLLFFGLELQEMPDEVFEQLVQVPELESYRHWLSVVRQFRPHKLTEPEEAILEETANTGSRAWVRFFEELHANHIFTLVKPDGTTEEMTEPEVLTLLRNPDRAMRLAGAAAFTKGLEELERSIVFCYNTLLQDKRIGDRLRKHPYPEHERHLGNELTKEVVDLVVGLCKKNYPLVARFYHGKRRLLGLPELTHVDRYAPLAQTESFVEFEEGKQIVLDAMGDFSPRLREAAKAFFDLEKIDAEPRKGKQGGAYCHPMTPDMHPVVFMNYHNKMDDVMTLAHELGHGVHGSLSRGLSYYNFHPTLPTAELASTFAEMLVFERLVARANDEEKRSLYAEKIEGIFATVFRQAAMFQFEQRAHLRRSEGEVPAEEFEAIWQEELQAMFGEAVKLGDEHRKWWMYIGHFFFAPFYVYSYSFGELVVLSLFALAKKEGPAFAERYEKMLSLGGSVTPAELLAVLGADMNSAAFWEAGFEALEGLVAEFERLA